MANITKKILKYVTDSDYRFMIKSNTTGCPKMSDEDFLRRKFKVCMGCELDLENPKTFNEKLQWLKLYNRRPEYTMMVDKYLVRDYIREKLGEKYLIPLIGAWDSPDEIDFDSLPDKFVLKCNHNSGVGMYICRDKSKMDVEKIKSELRKGLAQDYYLMGREWPYKNVKRKIICEKFMSDAPGASDFTDYKFFCFYGKVDSVMVCLERSSGDTKFYFFDEKWDLKRLNVRGKNAPKDFTIPKPECIDEMFKIAAELSIGIPFVRVDLYQSGGQIYFGEMTFFPDSGFDANLLQETDAYFGSLINLNKVMEKK